MEIKKAEAPTEKLLQTVRERKDIIKRPPEYFANIFIEEANRKIRNGSASVRDRTSLNFSISYPEGIEPSEKVKSLVRKSLHAAGWKEVSLLPAGYAIFFTLIPETKKKEKNQNGFFAKLKTFFS